MFRFGGKKHSVPPKRNALGGDFPTGDINDALLHLLRMLIRLLHLQGTGDELRAELTRLRSEIKRSVIPEDYEDLALKIQALELGAGFAELEPHHPGHLLSELIEAILPIARAMRGEGPIIALERLRNEADNPRANLKQELHAQLERLAEAVAFMRHVSEVFKLSIVEIMQTLSRLSGDEGMSSHRLMRLKDDIERADDNRSLEALRDRLLQAADGLVSEAEARQARLARVGEQVLEAKQQVKFLSAAMTDSKLMALTDPLTGFGSQRALSLESQELAQSRNATGLLLMNIDRISWPPPEEQREECELMLRGLARLVRSELRGEEGKAFHLGNGILAVVLPKSTVQEMDGLGERLCERFAALTGHSGQDARVASLACGGVLWGGGQTFAQAMELAQRARESAMRGRGHRYQRSG